MFFSDVVVIKRIEAVKNRVKTELEISVQVVDVKQQNWASFVKILDSKYKEFQQAFAKQKRFSDIFPLTVAKMTSKKTVFFELWMKLIFLLG